MKKISFILLSACLLFISCKKDEEKLSVGDYLIFGHFYGECAGKQCIEIFRLEQYKLYEDTTDIYPSFTNYYEGKYIMLSREQFNITKDLINYFPSDLLKETTYVIGTPDAGDWGGLYIEYYISGFRKFWVLDQMKTNVPSKYHNFIDKVNEKINQLNE